MMAEAPWVRSVYLYLMCLLSVLLVGIGVVGAVTGAVHTIAPDLGHRDTLDRVGIGVSNVASEVVDLFNEGQRSSVEDYCKDVTDGRDELDQCIQDETSLSGDSMDSIKKGIAQVKDELQSQIRNNSIDQLIRGLLLVGAGLFLFRIHGRRTELFADGLIPKRPAPEPSPPVPPPPSAIPEL